MSSAAEARFRVQAANSRAGAVKVFALDGAGEAVVRRLAGGTWTHTTFLTACSTEDSPHDLDGNGRNIADEVSSADLVVFVAGPGGGANAASAIGRACSVRRVMTTGLVVGAGSAPQAELSKTLAQLRPWSLMLIVANHDDCVDDMMAALRG